VTAIEREDVLENNVFSEACSDGTGCGDVGTVKQSLFVVVPYLRGKRLVISLCLISLNVISSLKYTGKPLCIRVIAY
jgi:hypothetical protein